MLVSMCFLYMQVYIIRKGENESMCHHWMKGCIGCK